jgi:hypothetical protein
MAREETRTTEAVVRAAGLEKAAPRKEESMSDAVQLNADQYRLLVAVRYLNASEAICKGLQSQRESMGTSTTRSPDTMRMNLSAGANLDVNARAASAARAASFKVPLS